MTARGISIGAGCLILLAIAHVTIQNTGGYGTPHSWLTIAVASGVAFASVFSGMAWTQRRRWVTVGLVAAIICGEAYGLTQTAERLVASREEQQAPLRRLSEDYRRAEQRVADATKAKDNLSTSSARLDRALSDKAATDAAVVSKSAERGCVENCRKLLQAQADAAEQEVGRARDEIVRRAQEAGTALANAKRDLEAMRPPVSATPLADRLGVESWKWDIIVAALFSMASNGLGCFLIVYGAHRPPHNAPTVAGSQDKAAQEPPVLLEAEPTPRPARRIPAAKRAPQPAPEPEIEHAKRFAVARLQPDEAAAVDMKAVVGEYSRWCKAAGADPLSPKAIIEALDSLFEIERRGDSYFLLDVSVRQAPAKLH